MFEVGIILLDKDRCYVYEDDILPIRPKFDKQLLSDLVETFSVSLDGYNMLPPSIKRLANVDTKNPQLAITIREIAECKFLIAIKGGVRYKKCKGVFRLDNFEELPISNSEVKFYIRRA